MLSHFRGSIVFSLGCLALGAWYGWAQNGSVAATASLVWIVIVLAVLEISLSFDNAVVNAKILAEMDPLWQRRFLTWGMLIAVFGMRIVFPLAIVAIAAGIGPVEALNLSLHDPQRYQQLVSSAHVAIAGFGGAFLTLVGLGFFFDAEKDVHWIGWIEAWLSRISSVKTIEIAALLAVLYALSLGLGRDEALTYLTSGILGIVTFIAVDAIGVVLEQRGAARAVGGVVVRAGLGAFLYLNVLDASFSFDGVIGAFALSNNMVVIALGLSIGAMFVRSMTVMLVDRGTLGEYRYLEHGAFWAIIALGAIMLGSVRWEVPDVLTGLIGAALIGAALGWSVLHNRRDGGGVRG